MYPPKRIQPVVLAIIEKDGMYLMTKRIDNNPEHHDKWQLPGGGLEFGEHPVEAMHRELREELNIKVNNLEFVPFLDIAVRDTWQGLFLVFHAELAEPEQHIKLNEEASEWQWFSLEEIQQLDVLKGCIEAVTTTYDYMKMKSSKN
ncbi:MAG: NUDIX hydrolase [Weeksellaceae bacterium]